MTDRHRPICVIPAGIGHFYRSSDLSGLRLALWEDGRPASCPLAGYLREAGARVDCLAVDKGTHPPAPAPRIRRGRGGDGLGPVTGPTPGSALWPMPGPALKDEIDAAVVNLGDPDPLARQLCLLDIPVVIFTEHPERCLEHYPTGICTDTSDGPEALASAVLLHVAIVRSGLHATPDLSVTEMLPRLRAMARVLVQDGALADALLEAAMVQALEYVPALGSDTEIGALLVMLIERIWIRQKLSRPS